uniref:Uncharacterized protein n=1 Tax=Talaromyces marneffei PM1 TaxID=1077442 RepID=A0A093UNB4_TALMA
MLGKRDSVVVRGSSDGGSWRPVPDFRFQELLLARHDWGPAYIVPGTKRGAMHRWRHLQLERTGFWAVATATTAVDSRSSKDTKST